MHRTIRAMSSYSRKCRSAPGALPWSETDTTQRDAGLVRFIPRNGSQAIIGEPVDTQQDVGIASYKSQAIEVETFSGSSILTPGSRTGQKVLVDRILSPLAEEEIGTIRCVGLNVSPSRVVDIPSSSNCILISPSVVHEPRERGQHARTNCTHVVHVGCRACCSGGIAAFLLIASYGYSGNQLRR